MRPTRERSALGLVVETLAGWSVRWPDARDVTLIDVASSTDATIDELRTRAHEHGLRLSITRLEHRAAEAVEHLGAGSFDYAHVGEALEHELPIVRLTTLRAAERLGRQGLLWSGLVRPPLGGAGFGRRYIRDAQRRLSMQHLSGKLPRMGGPFVLGSETPDAWTGLGEVAT